MKYKSKIKHIEFEKNVYNNTIYSVLVTFFFNLNTLVTLKLSKI
jgi:hypothetical protein